MYDTDIIEMEDFSFNHYIHHFDEYEDENIEYDTFELVAIESVEDIYWD